MKVINLISKWIKSLDPEVQKKNDEFWDTALDNRQVMVIIDSDNVMPVGRLPMEVGHA